MKKKSGGTEMKKETNWLSIFQLIIFVCQIFLTAVCGYFQTQINDVKVMMSNHVEHLQMQIDKIEANMSKFDTKLDDMIKTINKIDSDLSKIKGKLGY